MDNKIASERLRALATTDKKRSKTSRLLDLIDDVEAALAAGVSRSAVIEELAELGLEMTPPTFYSALHRIRKKRGKSSSNISKADSKNPASKSIPESPKNEGQGQADPDDEIDELAGLSAREKRERRIAPFTTDYKPTNPLYEMLINGKFG